MHDTTSTALSAFDIAAILVVASALLGWFNHHFLKLPHVIGLTVMGALGAIGLTVADAFIPGVTLDDWVADTLQQLNFTETLLQGMLSFLLFAGALHVDLDRLKVAWLPVLLLSTVGVMISTVLVGLAMWGVGMLLALGIAPIWYFVFGALIAPTDPVSVLGVLREEKVPQSLQSAVAGESLFNDGVGIVVFIILLGLMISRISTVFEVMEDLPTLGVRTGFLMQWVNGKEWGFVSLYMTQFLDDFGGGFQGGFSIIGIVTAYCIFGISAWTAFGQTLEGAFRSKKFTDRVFPVAGIILVTIGLAAAMRGA